MKRFSQIFLIDDDNITNLINKTLIQEWNLSDNISTFTQAEKALDIVEKGISEGAGPDLILLDLKMPVFDGFDFLEAYNNLSKPGLQETQVVVLTSSENPKDIQKLNELGVEWIMTKPLTEQQMQTLTSKVE